MYELRPTHRCHAPAQRGQSASSLPGRRITKCGGNIWSMCGLRPSNTFSTYEALNIAASAASANDGFSFASDSHATIKMEQTMDDTGSSDPRTLYRVVCLTTWTTVFSSDACNSILYM